MASLLEDLANRFPATDRAAWRENVERALKGRPFADALVRPTPEGLALEPLYTREDLPEGAALEDPGAPPYARGFPRPDGSPRRGWIRGAEIAYAAIDRANAAALADLEGGAERLRLRIVSATHALALAPDDARQLAASGRGGIWIETADDLERLLNGVLWSLAPVSLRAPCQQSFTETLFRACADLRRRGGHGLFTQIDVIDQARRSAGRTPNAAASGDGDTASDAAHARTPWWRTHGVLDEVQRAASVTTPSSAATSATSTSAASASSASDAASPSDVVSRFDARPFLISTVGLRLDGADVVQELAAAVGAFIALVRALDAEGIDRGAVLRACEFELASGSDFFTEIAKLRAFRLCLALALDTLGIGERASDVLVSAMTAEEMLTRHDVHVNMLRTTAGASAAVFGGTDCLFVQPFDLRFQGGSPLGRRMARNLHSLLGEEADAGAVTDPGGGSFYLERRTEQLAEAGWQQFVEWERAGGFFEACASGVVTAAMDNRWQARQRRLRTRREPVLGVSIFPRVDESAPPPSTFDADTFVNTWRTRATPAIDDACDTAPRGVESSRYVGDDFAELRDMADRIAARDGAAPAVFALLVGSPASYSARHDWVRDLFAAGGIRLIDHAADETLAGVADAFRASTAAASAAATAGATGSNARIAIIIAADALHAALVPTATAALREAGATHVLLAGRPGDREADDRRAGVTDFLFVGKDAYQFLHALLTELDAPHGRS